jgi:RimJ/RimL family protein N-acetyltransferase
VVVDPKLFAKTERLLLRPLRVEDAEDVVLMRKHPEVMKHTSILPSDDMERTREWIRGVRILHFRAKLVRNIQPPGACERDSSYTTDAVIGRLKDPRSLLVNLSFYIPIVSVVCGSLRY